MCLTPCGTSAVWKTSMAWCWHKWQSYLILYAPSASGCVHPCDLLAVIVSHVIVGFWDRNCQVVQWTDERSVCRCLCEIQCVTWSIGFIFTLSPLWLLQVVLFVSVHLLLEYQFFTVLMFVFQWMGVSLSHTRFSNWNGCVCFRVHRSARSIISGGWLHFINVIFVLLSFVHPCITLSVSPWWLPAMSWVLLAFEMDTASHTAQGRIFGHTMDSYHYRMVIYWFSSSPLVEVLLLSRRGLAMASHVSWRR